MGSPKIFRLSISISKLKYENGFKIKNKPYAGISTTYYPSN
jgi:hypothetical protein